MLFRHNNLVIFDCWRHSSGQSIVSLWFSAGRHYYLKNTNEAELWNWKELVFICYNFFFCVCTWLHTLKSVKWKYLWFNTCKYISSDFTIWNKRYDPILPLRKAGGAPYQSVQYCQCADLPRQFPTNNIKYIHPWRASIWGSDVLLLSAFPPECLNLSLLYF